MWLLANEGWLGCATTHHASTVRRRGDSGADLAWRPGSSLPAPGEQCRKRVAPASATGSLPCGLDGAGWFALESRPGLSRSAGPSILLPFRCEREGIGLATRYWLPQPRAWAWAWRPGRTNPRRLWKYATPVSAAAAALDRFVTGNTKVPPPCLHWRSDEDVQRLAKRWTSQAQAATCNGCRYVSRSVCLSR